jgi:hypothetical protein
MNKEAIDRWMNNDGAKPIYFDSEEMVKLCEMGILPRETAAIIHILHQIRSNKHVGKNYWASISGIAKIYGCHRSNLSRACKLHGVKFEFNRKEKGKEAKRIWSINSEGMQSIRQHGCSPIDSIDVVHKTATCSLIDSTTDITLDVNKREIINKDISHLEKNSVETSLVNKLSSEQSEEVIGNKLDELVTGIYSYETARDRLKLDAKEILKGKYSNFMFKGNEGIYFEVVWNSYCDAMNILDVKNTYDYGDIKIDKWSQTLYAIYKKYYDGKSEDMVKKLAVFFLERYKANGHDVHIEPKHLFTYLDSKVLEAA